MPTKIETIASDIMQDAYSRGGSFNRHPVGYGYESLPEKDKFQVINLIEKYGEIKDCLPCSWYFNNYELNSKGIELHEQFGSYLNCLAHQEQEKKDKELDRQLKQLTIESQKKTVELAEKANEISKEANKLAEEANRKSFYSNLIAFFALIVSIIAIIVSYCK